MDLETFDSRSSAYKRPYGAVASGTKVRFTLRPPRLAGYSRCTLTARLEFEGERRIEVRLPWVGMEGGRDLFSGTLDTTGYVGLIWYSFRLERLNGGGEESGERQLTVYDGSEKVPEWFGEGVTYQIFPDRFHRLSVPDPAGMPGGRWVHRRWEEEPAWGPDGSGEVRNRDFFGGSLPGIREKLPYLKELGVDTLYLCPIFEAPENHRYGVGDYEKIDPMLGTKEDFTALCDAAHAQGMRVILDGVFNHTAYVSKYFNGDGSYPTLGAAQSKDSPYYSWFSFQHWPDRYSSWWGIYTLPSTNKQSGEWLNYITGEDGIIRSWLRAGADGWRLDVADELPDFVVERIHAAARAEKPDAIVIGEVWEDGSNKIAYSVRRRHLLGRHCDGLMNYPFRGALLSYLMGGDAGEFRERMETLRENYPPFATHSAMNLMGTHDTLRILTLLGVGSDCLAESKDWRAKRRLTPQERERGLALTRLGALILFAFPGSPMVYYGDEAGMEGFEDPFNRGTFPWGREDAALTAWYAALGKARHSLAALRRGSIRYLRAQEHVLAFLREAEGERVVCAANAGEAQRVVTLRTRMEGTDLLTGERLAPGEDGLAIPLPPRTGRLVLLEGQSEGGGRAQGPNPPRRRAEAPRR